MTDRYAVIGNPVAHSKSPEIHAEFARQTAQDIDYAKLPAPLDGFRSAIAAFRAAGGRGANVTLPFKLEAFELADIASRRASDAGAANFLRFDDGRIRADNTDGVGLTRDIEHNLGFGLAGKRVLLLGAGGAAQGVIVPLLEHAPLALTIANRTAQKAVRLADLMRGKRVTEPGMLRGVGYGELAGQQFDLVINATSASLHGDLPPLPRGIFAAGALAYDMVYGTTPTAFLEFAAARGAKIADGLGMLVEQAAESFLLWRGVRPQTAPVIALLRCS
jgi:shikimate dehydrogenase